MALVLLTAGAVLPQSAQAATPAQSLAADNAAFEKAVTDRVAAEQRLDRVKRRATVVSEDLDALIDRQAEAETRLSTRARNIYRAGQGSFLSVLLNAESLEGFTVRWSLLTRISEQDARAVREVKAARKKAVRGARRLLTAQEAASQEMRKLASVEAAARKKLGASQAAYAAYRQRVAVTRSRTTVAAPGKTIPAKVKEKPAKSAPRLSGTGEWSTAVASHYGRNFRGRTADGSRIGPDSMIVAHKTLPFDTMVEFSFGGKTAVARVADRGPYTKGRSFDLGPGVIRILGFNGVHEVKYRVIGR